MKTASTNTGIRILLILVYIFQEISGEDTDNVNGGSCWMDGNSTTAFRHNQRCKAALEDERNEVNTFYMTSSGSITALVSGTLSAVSSLIILFLIKRSHIGISSIYHRIMCGICVSDFISSVAVAFNTLPLPKDVIYNFDPGWVRGNQTTCTIQGFLLLTFFSINGIFNCMLAIYYVLAINRKKRDIEIQKNKLFTKILPILGISVVLIGSVLGLLARSFNPTPFDAWCATVSYPYYCTDKDEDENSCLRERNATLKTIVRSWLAIQLRTLTLMTYLTIFAPIAVAIGVYRQQLYINEIDKLVYGNDSAQFDGAAGRRRLESTKKRQAYVKALYVQCVAYIVTSLVCNLSYLAHVMDRIDHTTRELQFYHASMRPLQGLFNLLIFVGHKSYDIRVIDRSLTIKEAIIKVFRDREEKKFLISNISIVRDSRAFYFDGEEQEREMYADADADADESQNEDRDEEARRGNDRTDNLNDGTSDQHESGVSFDDAVGGRSQFTGDSRLSNDEKSSSRISNYSELFGSWVSRTTESRKDSSTSISGSPAGVNTHLDDVSSA